MENRNQSRSMIGVHSFLNPFISLSKWSSALLQQQSPSTHIITLCQPYPTSTIVDVVHRHPRIFILLITSLQHEEWGARQVLGNQKTFWKKIGEKATQGQCIDSIRDRVQDTDAMKDLMRILDFQNAKIWRMEGNQFIETMSSMNDYSILNIVIEIQDKP